MTALAKGTVEAVSIKGPVTGQYGEFFNVSVKIGEEWFSKTSKTGKEVNRGDSVEILYQVNDKGFKNIIKDGLTILEKAAAVSGQTAETGTAATSTAGTRKPYENNTLGMIKGNTVTNAVTLATARAGTKTTLDDLKAAALDVLALHGHLEAMDIKEVMSPKPVVKKEVKTATKATKAQLEADPFAVA